MCRFLLLLFIMLLHAVMLHAQPVKATFRNAVDATPVTAGTLSLYNIATQTWVFQGDGSPHEEYIFNDTEYRARTDQDRLLISNAWKKHHLWDYQIGAYLLSNDFSVPQGNYEVDKTAVFTDASKTTLFHNFEEFTDEGEVRFRDPWYYVNTEHDQPDALLPFTSPYVPTGAYDKSEPAVLLNKTAWPGNPFYSLKFHSFLQSDYVTPKTTALTGDDWVFIGAHARNADDVDLTLPAPDDYWSESNGVWSRGDEYAVDVEFKNNESELFGFYKRHLHSSSEIHPTAINSQSKIGKEKADNSPTKYHQVYESDGKIYYTWSDDTRSDFDGEVLVSDFAGTAIHPSIDVLNNLVSIVYVDVTNGNIVLKQRQTYNNPANWTTVYTSNVSNSSLTHPVVRSRVFNSRIFTILIWENEYDLMYSVFLYGSILSGLRVDHSQQNIVPCTFDAIVLEPGLQYPNAGRGTPKYPALSVNQCGNDFGVTWSERPREVLRYKGLEFGVSTEIPQRFTVRDNLPILLSANHPIRDNTAPSMCIMSATSWCVGTPVIAYELDHVSSGPTSGFPIPTTLTTWPLSVQGRFFMPVSLGIAGYTRPWIPNFNSVVLKSGNDFPYATKFPYVTQVQNYSKQTNDELAPSIGNILVSDAGIESRLAVAFNVDHQGEAYRLIRFNAAAFPFQPTWDSPSDGLYPQIAGNYLGAPVVAFSNHGYQASTAVQGSKVEGHDILHAISHTTNGVRKTAEQVYIDQLRRITFSINDTAHAYYGVATPHLVENDSVFTPLSWDTSCDTLPYFWWSDLKTWIRTEAFPVPQSGGQVIFGTELYARNAIDFGANFRMALECRDASNHEVLYTEEFSFTGFNPDSALYVQDEIDLSSIAGDTVYFCINPIDTTSSCSFEAVNVITPWFESLEKRGGDSKPVTKSIRIGQNYPNPFNPTTVIPFELAEDGHVTIQILDMLGRVVRTLREGYISRGAHTVAFDGSGLRSGMYVCRITAFDQIAAVKMHLIK